MSNKSKWIPGISLLVILLFLPLFVYVFIIQPANPYHRMIYSYNWHMPMIYSGGMLGVGMPVLMWLLLWGLLVLTELGIAWLIHALTAAK